MQQQQPQYQPTSPPPQQAPPPIPPSNPQQQQQQQYAPSMITTPNINPGYNHTGNMMNPSSYYPQQPTTPTPYNQSSFAPNQQQQQQQPQQSWPTATPNSYGYSQPQYPPTNNNTYPPMQQQGYPQQQQGSYPVPNPMAAYPPPQQYHMHLHNPNGIPYNTTTNTQPQQYAPPLSSSGMSTGHWNTNHPTGTNQNNNNNNNNTMNPNAVGRYSSTTSSSAATLPAASTTPYSNNNNNNNSHNDHHHPSSLVGTTNTTRSSSSTASSSVVAASIRRPPFVDPDTNIVYDVNDPDYEGWLFKQSQWLKEWRKRYFILKGSKLFFCKHPTSGAPHGMMDLSICTTVKSADLKSGKFHSLEISTPDTCYLLQAETESEKDDWIGRVGKAIVRCSRTYYKGESSGGDSQHGTTANHYNHHNYGPNQNTKHQNDDDDDDIYENDDPDSPYFND